MKKIVSLLMTMFLIGQVIVPIQASDKSSSIAGYGEGEELLGGCEVEQVALSDELQGWMMATDTSLVLSGHEDFNIYTGYPVKDFVVLDDIDKDGIKDMAVYLDVKDGYDNFAIISSKESKVLYKTKLVHQGADEQGNISDANSKIRQLLYSKGMVYILYDYHILAIDTNTYKTMFDFVETNNIWKMILVEDKIVYTNQLGAVGAIDKQSGREVYTTDIAPTMHPNIPYNDNKFEVTMSTWDLIYVNGYIYVTSEDGQFLQIEKDNGEVINAIELDVASKKEIETSLANYSSFNASTGRHEILATGSFSYSFMGYKIRMIKDNTVVIEAYLGDESYQEIAGINDNNGRKLSAMLVIIDLKEMKVKTKISLEQYSLKASNVVLGIYEGKEALLVPSSVTKGSLKILAYSLEDGMLIGQKTLRDSSIPSDNTKVFMMNDGAQYILRMPGSSIIGVASDLKNTVALHHALSVNVVSNVSDGTIVSYQKDGKVFELKKIGLQNNEDIQASVTLPTTYPTARGFEALHFDEQTNHMLSLVNEVNANNEIIGSHIVIMDMSNGMILQDKKILLDKGYDENNKYYEQFLIGETIHYFGDINKDGKQEILVDQNIIDGASLTVKSSYNPSVEDSGNMLVVGDLNNDGIDDIVCVGEAQMRVYHSNISGFDINYKKTDTVKKYDKELQNQVYAKVVGDLDNDGIEEIVVNAKNNNGYQNYQVVNAKDLSVRFHLLEEGVYDYGESFSLLHIDVNHDGIQDILYVSPFSKNYVISGKDGSTLLEYAPYSYDDYEESPASPSMLDAIVEFNIVEHQGDVIMLDDFDDDGKKDIGYINKYYQYNKETMYLVIVSSQSLKELEKIEIRSGDGLNYTAMIPVENQAKIIYYDGQENGYSQIFDYKAKELLAGHRMEVAYARGLQDGQIQVQTVSQQIFSIRDDQDFKLDLKNNAKIQGNLNCTYESQKFGVMEVYDQGKLVLKTTDKTLAMKLLPGKHTLTFSYDDGHGKITHQTRQIEVRKSSMLRYAILLISLVLVVLGGLYPFYPKFKLVKKVGVKHG